MSKRLSGKVAIVTGAASGVGEAVARRFVSEGAQVLMTDLNEADGTRIATEIGATNAFAFDLQAACSSFLYGMSTASAYIIFIGNKAVKVKANARIKFKTLFFICILLQKNKLFIFGS